MPPTFPLDDVAGRRYTWGMTKREIFKPASIFIPGTNIYSNIERWEIVGRRVYVVFNDGLVMHSDYTPSEIRGGTFAVAEAAK